jgi:hypothetical protein
MVPWRPLLVFYNPRFRRLVLWIIGSLAVGGYVWSVLVVRFTTQQSFSDFEDFFTAAAAIKRGVDPYQSILAHGHYDFTHFYPYPPLTAWLLQPLLPLGDTHAALLTLLVLQVFVVAFFWLTYKALQPVSWHEIAFGVILALNFGPIFANLWNDQINIVLLPLCAVLLLAYRRGDRWWGGAAYGLAMALKPLQPVPGLLLVWGRRPRMLAGAVIVGLAALAIPGPARSVEFIFKVLPTISGGTGFRANAAPAGFLERLFNPDAFYDATATGGWGVKLLYVGVVAAVIGLTWWRLGRTPRTTQLGRLSEVAVAIAASPLVLTISNNWHLVLLLIPILVLIRVGLARTDGWVLAAALIAWLLIGPAYSGVEKALEIGWFTTVSATIDSNPVFRVLNECQLAGMIILWLGCLRALGRPAAVAPAAPGE